MLPHHHKRLFVIKYAPLRLWLNVIFTLCLAGAFCPTYNAAYGQKKLALLVGISNYKPGNGWNKISSNNDIHIISHMLQRQGFDSANIHVIEEEKATKEGIVNGLQQLTKEAQPGDIVYFHFSGHGQQIYDDNGDEEDGYDEALVTWDAPMRYYAGGPEKHLRDDLLDTLFTAIRKKIAPAGQLVVTLDECHSGTGARDVPQDKAIRRGTEIVYAPRNYAPNIKKTAAAENFESLSNAAGLAPVIIVSACAPQEINYEYSKAACGSLTFALSQTFETIDSATTYRAFFDHIKSVMARIAKNQMPQIEGNIDYTIFGGKVNTAIPYFTIQKVVNATTVVINGGKLQNLSEGSKIGFYPPDTRDTSKVKPVAYGTVIRADNLNATVQVENPGLLNEQQWVMVTERAYPFEVSFNYSDNFPAALKKIIAGAFTSFKTLHVDATTPDVLLQYSHSKDTAFCSLINAQGYTTDSLNIADEQFVSKLKLAVLKTGQANYLRGIAASNTNDSITIEAEFIPVECDKENNSGRIKKLLDKRTIMDEQGLNYILKNGTCFQLKLTNKGTVKAYYTIIDIQPDDRINFIIPKQDEQPSSYSLEPLQEKIFPVSYSVSPPYGNEVLEVIASAEPVELNLLHGKRGSLTGHQNAFSQLLDAIKDDMVLSRGLDATAAGAPVGVFVIHYKIVP